MVICSFACVVATAKYWRFDTQLEAAGADWAAAIAAVMTLLAALAIDAPNAARNGAALDALLTQIATNAVGPPPIEPQISSPSPRSKANDLVLREVDLDEQSGKFLFFFDTPIGDKIQLWPMVTFEGWSVKEAEWVP